MDWCTEDLVKTLQRQLNKLNYEEYDNYNQPTNKQLLNNNCCYIISIAFSLHYM